MPIPNHCHECDKPTMNECGICDNCIEPTTADEFNNKRANDHTQSDTSYNRGLVDAPCSLTIRGEIK